MLHVSHPAAQGMEVQHGVPGREGGRKEGREGGREREREEWILRTSKIT